jgi:hypothetical protein
VPVRSRIDNGSLRVVTAGCCNDERPAEMEKYEVPMRCPLRSIRFQRSERSSLHTAVSRVPTSANHSRGISSVSSVCCSPYRFFRSLRSLSILDLQSIVFPEEWRDPCVNGHLLLTKGHVVVEKNRDVRVEASGRYLVSLYLTGKFALR